VSHLRTNPPGRVTHFQGDPSRSRQCPARETGILLDKALRRIEARGIEAASAETLREVAARAGLRPHDVRAILAGESAQ